MRPAPTHTTSLRSQKPAWHRAAARNVTQESTKQRLFVFVAGGMTYSEVREVYELSSLLSKDIYIGMSTFFPISRTPLLRYDLGSTHTITPRPFIDDLKVLDLGGVGSRALPNGLQESAGHRPYQDFYDQKYYTQDGPRPQPKPAPGTLAPPKERSRPQPSPTESYSSTNSFGKEEKKKKKGLFRF